MPIFVKKPLTDAAVIKFQVPPGRTLEKDALQFALQEAIDLMNMPAEIAISTSDECFMKLKPKEINKP